MNKSPSSNDSEQGHVSEPSIPRPPDSPTMEQNNNQSHPMQGEIAEKDPQRSHPL